ncbi:MAG: hypothetical protein EBR94_11760 [Bacteroidetes bacterium]|nr:hypothetical protein [Bacteroidota bacterium]
MFHPKKNEFFVRLYVASGDVWIRFSYNIITGEIIEIQRILSASSLSGSGRGSITFESYGRFFYALEIDVNQLKRFDVLNAVTGALTSVGTTAAGIYPQGVACDPTGKFVYVTNWSSATVQAYTINASTGALTSVGAVSTGTNPFTVACDPTGKFVFVPNWGSGTVQAYTINASTGALTSVGTTATEVNPYGVACDPTGKFVYVTNFTSSTVQAYTINAANRSGLHDQCSYRSINLGGGGGNGDTA